MKNPKLIIKITFKIIKNKNEGKNKRENLTAKI